MGNNTGRNFTTSDDILTMDEREVVRIAEFISSSLSILGASSIILISICKQKVFRPEVHPLFHLSMADLLAAIFVIFGLGVYGYEIDDAPYVCYWITGLAVGMYLSTFMLTFVYALEAYIRTKAQLQRRPIPQVDGNRDVKNICSPWFMGLAYVVAWGLPIFMIIGIVLPTQRIGESMPPVCKRMHYGCLVMFHQSEDPCLDRTDDAVYARLALKTFFLFVLVTVSIGLFVLYYLTHRTLRRIQNLQGVIGPRQYEEARRVRNRGILYCAVFIICWLPALIIGFLSYFSSINIKNIFWLYTLQSIMTPLQGFLNCLIYGWIRGSFQRALNIGTESTLLSWSTRGGIPSLENTRFTDYGTLSNTDDDYETLSEGESSKAKIVAKHTNGVVFLTSESGS